MRILILGATGMLGHKLCQRLSASHEVIGTVRGSIDELLESPIFVEIELRGGVDAWKFETVERIIKSERPDVVINCIGIIKQLKDAKDPRVSIAINALFPHELATCCAARGTRLIHFSTDCVFSGKDGNYVETDYADADDLYGRTKFLGEVTIPGCLTLRTSVIGRELFSGIGLLEWFFSQRGGRVKGFTNALYTGFSTSALADLVDTLICKFPEMEGVWHASSNSISKFDLLCIVNEVFELGTQIDRDDTFVCDRCLDSTRLRKATGFHPYTWRQMIEEIKVDPTPYRLIGMPVYGRSQCV